MTDDATSPPVRRLADWDPATLSALAAEHGTPLYVTDLDRVRANYRRLRGAFPDAHLMYAAKANTGRHVIETLHDEGADLECAAAGEVLRAVDAGVAPADVRYTAVNPPDGDLDFAVEVFDRAPEFTVTVGAESTMDRLADRGFDGRLAIRVNPAIGAGHHEKVATGADAKFGVPYERVPELAARATDRFDLVGLHMHVGSNILGEDLANHRRAVARLAEVARETEREADVDLEFVDVGGGLGVPYREDEPPLDLDDFADTTREALGDLDARLALEPGRYLVADASVIVTEVNTRKVAPEDTVIGVDASMTTLLRPAMFDSYHPMRNLTGDAEGRDAEPVTVGGPICSSADVFCRNRPVARVEIGDLLAIGNAGAYGYEMAMQFHSQPRPAEVAVEDGQHRVVRRRETMDDVVRLEQ